jgi:hypothetical protein
VATDGAVAAGRWSGLIEPSGRSTLSNRFGGDLPLASSLASDAGLRTPEIGWLVGFLAVYVVVVGPVVFFAVRRRQRPELAWVAVPLVALLFTSGSWAVGRNLRNATELVHASIVSSSTGGPVATTYVGVFSRSGETARIGFPAGWSSGPYSTFGQAAAASVVNRTANGLEAFLPLDPGQFGMVHATGPAPEGAGGLQITAGLEPGGRVTGTVRNPTPFGLEAVAVFAGSDVTVVGRLDPGQERPFTMSNLDRPRMDGGDAEFRIWGGMGFGNPESVADIGLWQAVISAGGANFRSPDAVVAAGWTRDYQPEVRIGRGVARPEGRTVVLGRQAVSLAGTGSTPIAARREIVRDPFTNRFNGPQRGAGTVVRFVLPDGADTSKLVLKNPFGAADVWKDGAWQAVRCDGANCPGGPPGVQNCPPGVRCPPPGPGFPGPFGPTTELAVPTDSIRDGVVFARLPGPASIEMPFPITIGRTA